MTYTKQKLASERGGASRRHSPDLHKRHSAHSGHLNTSFGCLISVAPFRD